ncbi:hypothetical protein [Haladaptatus sp. CMSO5]|uniref:hypothetical protein n=1 Tax=Haladaptatus sp. CMSO5 TaxID=3120514 RepID=UPI002FCE569B
MSPTRRSLLRFSGLAATGLLAGCVSNGASPNTTDTTTTDGGLPGSNNTTGNGAGGTRPTGTGGPGLSLHSTDEQPNLPLELAVKVTHDVATDDAPPQLKVTLTNTSDEQLMVGEGRAIFFQYKTDDDRQLMLLPAAEEYDAEPGCWRLNEPIAVTEEYRMRTVDPGTSISEKIDLYGAPEGDGCLPVGNFHFTTTYNVVPTESMETAEQKSDAWGFTVTLE